jgi:hypothetical protein
MALRGGKFGWGTMFALNTNGTSFTLLHTFLGPYVGPFGGYPEGGLLLANNTLFGTTTLGGGAFYGTVFRFALPQPPTLTLMRSGPNIILTWPTNEAQFNLQSATSVASPVWSTYLLPPVVVNGQNTVISRISGGQAFYRLAWVPPP